MPKKINFVYKDSEDLSPLYVNGAYGGFGPQSDFFISFYREQIRAMKDEEKQLDDEGNILPLQNATDMENNNHVEVNRYVVAKIVVTVESVKAIHSWLTDQLKTFEEAKKGR